MPVKHIFHASGVPLCGETAVPTSGGRDCLRCAERAAMRVSLEGYSITENHGVYDLRLGRVKECKYWNLDRELAERFLDLLSDLHSARPFSMALATIPYDGNLGIYADEPLTEISISFIGDRRKNPARHKDSPFVCDGIEAGAFVKFAHEHNEFNVISIAEMFLNERNET